MKLCLPAMIFLLLLQTNIALAQSVLVPGDMNGDQTVDLFDTVATINVILGTRPFVKDADINRDTDADEHDVSLSVKLALGYPVAAHSDPMVISKAPYLITIRGGHFDPIASNNKVSINGTPALVQSVTLVNGNAVALVVRIGTGTTTGAIKVLSGSRSAANTPPLVIGGAAYSIDDISVNEGDETATLTLNSGFGESKVPKDFQITVCTKNGVARSRESGLGNNDFTLINEKKVTFSKGGSATAQVVIVITDDLVNEGLESFSLFLSQPEVKSGEFFTSDMNSTIIDNTGLVTIVDNDESQISINDVTVAEGKAETTELLFTVCVDKVSSSNIQVRAKTQDGSAKSADNDYVASSKILTISAGLKSALFRVTVNNNPGFEVTEQLFVNLTEPSEGFGKNPNISIEDDQGIGTITNAAPPPPANYSIDDVTVNERAGKATVVIDSGLKELLADYQITVSTIDGSAFSNFPDENINDSDFVSHDCQIVFKRGGSPKAQITIDIHDDKVNEKNEQFSVAISQASYDVGQGFVDDENSRFADDTAVVTIEDDDHSEVKISDPYIREGNIGVVTLTFTVSIDIADYTDISVIASTTDGTASTKDNDYSANTKKVTLSAGRKSARFSIVVKGDLKNEGDETVLVNLKAPAEGLGDNPTTTILKSQGVGTIINDDGGPPTFDFNGDGIADTVTGFPYADPKGRKNAGVAYVLFGSKNPPAVLDLATLKKEQGVLIQGAHSSDLLGFKVAEAGDFNDDGVSDIIVGAYTSTRKGRSKAGTCYVIYGSTAPPPSIDLARLTQAQGLTIQGAEPKERLGVSVSGLGDFNNDGISDVVVGTLSHRVNGNGSHGKFYVLFGSAKPPATIDLASIKEEQGFCAKDVGARSFGYDVSTFGDFNHDGLTDIVAGAFSTNPDYLGWRPLAYIIYGTRTGRFGFERDQFSYEDGVKIESTARERLIGRVSSIGDFNNDGVDDIVVGTIFLGDSKQKNTGVAYVIYGSRVFSSVNLESLTRRQGLIIKGAAPGDRLGMSVSRLGDFNNDGVTDILVGAPSADRFGRKDIGEAYIIYGSTKPPAAINLATLTGSQGLIIEGAAANDRFGSRLKSFGDFNNDGISDAYIGAAGATANGRINSGASYVIYGLKNPPNRINAATLSKSQGLVIQGAAAYDSTKERHN